jgi:hypothetical protein
MQVCLAAQVLSGTVATVHSSLQATSGKLHCEVLIACKATAIAPFVGLNSTAVPDWLQPIEL